MDEDEIAHFPPEPADPYETTPARKPVLQALAVLITVVVPALLLFITITNANNAAAPPPDPIAALLPNPGFEDGLTGWVDGYAYQDGVDPNQGYKVDIDHAVAYSSTASARIHLFITETNHLPNSYGHISARLPADYFRGKRVRYSAYIRTQAQPDKIQPFMFAGIYMAVPGIIDGRPTDPDIPLSSDGFGQGQLYTPGSNWQKYQIVLDVPQEASFLLFGLRVEGYGQAWIDDVKLEVVGSDVASTDKAGKKTLDNLDFEDGLTSWETNTVQDGQTSFGTGIAMAHSGKLGAFVIQRTYGEGQDFGSLVYSWLYGGYYQNKKVRLSAYVNVDKLPDGATLFLAASYLNESGKPGPPIDSAAQALHSTSGWQNVQATLDIPARTYAVIFGVRPNGNGELWLDDVHLDILGPASTPTP